MQRPLRGRMACGEVQTRYTTAVPALPAQRSRSPVPVPSAAAQSPPHARNKSAVAIHNSTCREGDMVSEIVSLRQRERSWRCTVAHSIQEHVDSEARGCLTMMVHNCEFVGTSPDCGYVSVDRSPRGPMMSTWMMYPHMITQSELLTNYIGVRTQSFGACDLQSLQRNILSSDRTASFLGDRWLKCWQISEGAR